MNNADQTPEELLEMAYQKLYSGLSKEVLEIVKSCSPAFFERLVIDLLIAMGYGGSRRDAQGKPLESPGMVELMGSSRKIGLVLM